MTEAPTLFKQLAVIYSAIDQAAAAIVNASNAARHAEALRKAQTVMPMALSAPPAPQRSRHTFVAEKIQSQSAFREAKRESGWP